MIEYCAASSADAEDFQRVIAGTWWEAALEYADDNEDEINDQALYHTEKRAGVEHAEDSDITPADRARVTVAVGIALKPKPLSELFKGHNSAQDLIRMLVENHDDYQLECAEDYKPLKYIGNDAENVHIKDALVPLAADIADALAKFERIPGMAPDWFIVKKSADVSLGVAEAAAQCAALIDMSGKLYRDTKNSSMWVGPASTPMVDGGCGLIIYNLWQAAEFCGLIAPVKPNGWCL